MGEMMGPPPPDNVVFITTGHGTLGSKWRPTGSGSNFTLSDILKPLEPYKNELIVIEGLDNNQVAASCTHYGCSGTLLTGAEGSTHQIDGASGSGGGAASIDAILGQEFLLDTPISALNLGVLARQGRSLDYFTTSTWAARDTPNLPLDDPDVVFDFLRPYIFGGSFPLLDAIDRSVDPRDLPKVAKTQMDLVHASLAIGLTRVATVQLLSPSSLARFRFLAPEAGDNSYNAIMHDARWLRPDQAAALITKVQRWFAQQVAYLLGKLKATPAGNGTLLDHTLVVWMSESGIFEIGQPALRHRPQDIPVVLAGNVSGKLKTGQYLKFGARQHVDLLLTIAQVMGLDIQTIGDPALRAKPITQILSQ